MGSPLNSRCAALSLGLTAIDWPVPSKCEPSFGKLHLRNHCPTSSLSENQPNRADPDPSSFTHFHSVVLLTRSTTLFTEARSEPSGLPLPIIANLTTSFTSSPPSDRITTGEIQLYNPPCQRTPHSTPCSMALQTEACTALQFFNGR